MGWCSGTEIFDVVCSNVLTSTGKIDKEALIKGLIEVMWEHDWDCEFDSDYIDDEFVRKCFIDLDSKYDRQFKEWDDDRREYGRI